MSLRIVRNVHPELGDVAPADEPKGAYAGAAHADVGEARAIPIEEASIRLRTIALMRALSFPHAIARKMAEAGYGFVKYDDPSESDGAGVAATTAAAGKDGHEPGSRPGAAPAPAPSSRNQVARRSS